MEVPPESVVSKPPKTCGLYALGRVNQIESLPQVQHPSHRLVTFGGDSRWLNPPPSGTLSRMYLLRLAAFFITLAAPLWAAPGDAVIATLVPEGMEARSTALILTDPADWSAETEARAARLAQLHTLVVAVDAPALWQAEGITCDSFGPALAELALSAQSAAGAYARTPVLVGTGQGRALALLAATEGPARFKGLVTLAAPAPTYCPERPFGPDKAPLRWLDLTADAVSSPAAPLAGATVFDLTEDPEKAFTQAYLRLAGTDSAFDLEGLAAAPALADLPLTLHRDAEAPPSDTYAIFLSGDGGWARFDEEVASRLAAAGIPTLGLSSLRYLWQEKSPQEIATDFARIDAQYRSAFGASRVLIVGFSLGANVVPFAATDLPPEMQESLAALALLAPEVQTGFEIVVGGWLGRPTGAHQVTPQIDKAAQRLAAPVLCLYGSKESVSACPGTTAPRIAKHMFEGGHHLAKDYDRIAQILIEATQTQAPLDN